MDQRVVHDDVVAAEQMADHRDVRRVSADQRDAVLGAVDPCQRAFELAVYRPLARNRPARRDRGAIAIDRCLGGGRDPRVAVEPDVIV